MNSERLLNVAKTLREAAHNELFTMRRYVHDCGTPACAIGHYAARADLQSIIRIDHGSILYVATDEDGQSEIADYDDDQMCEHFGISEGQAHELFSGDGCGKAKTPIEAAEYIERFVADASGR